MALRDLITEKREGFKKLVDDTKVMYKENQTPEKQFSGVPKYSGEELTSQFLASQQQYPGLDSFKSSMRQNVDLTPFDSEIKALNDRKSQLYADMIKHADAKGYTIDPKNVRENVEYEANKIDLEIANIEKEMKNRLAGNDKEAEYQYSNLSNEFINARTKQQQVQQALDEELTKPKSDPDTVRELQDKVKEADKEYTTIKKEFDKKGVKDPEVILRKHADINKQEGGVQSVMKDVAFGQYNDKDGTFNTKTFVKDLQKDPIYANLSPEDTARKLLETEADENTIKDMAFIASEIAPTTEKFVDLVSDKGYIDTELADIVFTSYLENVGGAKKADAVKLDEMIDALKNYGLDRNTMNEVLAPYSIKVNRDRQAE